MYLTREDWIHHMKSEHTVKQWLCQYCSDKDKGRALLTYPTADDLTSHLRNSHPSTKQSVLPLHVLVDNSVRHILPKVHCPLCPGEVTVYDLETTSHVAGHLHSFSLTALPWEDEIPETGSSSHKLGSAQGTTPSNDPVIEDIEDIDDDQDEDDVFNDEDAESGDSGPLSLESDMMVPSRRSQSAEVAAQSPAANEDLDEVPGIDASPTDILDEEKVRSPPRSYGPQESVVDEPLLYPHQETVRAVDEETSDRGRSRTRSSKSRSRKSQFGKAVQEHNPTTNMEGVLERLPSYRLRRDVLGQYLQSIFPDYVIRIHPDDRSSVRTTFSIYTLSNIAHYRDG